MDLQILVNGSNWMASDCDIHWPIGGKNKYRRFSAPPCNAGKRVHRRKITPMQVFENDHPRSFGSQAFHEIAKLAKHTLPCGSEDFLLERSTIFLAKKAWHLCQPCRRVIAKRLKQGRSIGSTAQFVQSLDQRQEGLVGSEKFAATTMQRAHARAPHCSMRSIAIWTNVVLPIPASPVTKTT